MNWARGFNPEFSGRENVFLAASILGLSTAEIKERFESIVDFSGIRDFIDQPIKVYSSGMYVRLSRSRSRRASIRTSWSWTKRSRWVTVAFARKSFDRIMALKKAGVTVLFCSHSLYQVEAFCNRVLSLEHGYEVRGAANFDDVAQDHANPRAMCTIATSVFPSAAFHLATAAAPRVSSARFAASGRLR